MSILVTISS